MKQNTPIDNLISAFSKLPGIGPRSARRVVLQLIRDREKIMHPLISALQEADSSIVTCETCGNIDSTSPCHICTDVKRDSTTLCVVEDIADLWAMDRSHVFKGRYHVLGGTLSAMDGRGPDALNMDALINRAKAEEVTEVILAMNATVEGQTTAHYLTELLSECNVKTSRLAHGIPMGGELDYLDDGTLGAALMARVSD